MHRREIAAAAPPAADGSSGFLAPVHAFRGLAIAAIVAAHATFPLYDLHGGVERGSPGRIALQAAAETLFHDSTILFALLSGLLYSLALAGRRWSAFFRAKALHVGLPYAIMSLLYVALTSGAGQTARSALDLLMAWLGALPTGGAVFHFWYMPVLFVLYAATPAVATLVRRPQRRWLFLLIVLAPLLVSRRWPQWSWATPVYFLGAYTAGMWAGAHYPLVLARIRRDRAAIAAVAILTSVVLLVFIARGLKYLGPVNLQETLFYVQKMAFAALALGWLHSRKGAPPLLLRLGDQAFPIYFVHVIPIFLFVRLIDSQTVAPLPAWRIALLGIAILAGSLAASWGLSRQLRLALGRRSRFVIGA